MPLLPQSKILVKLFSCLHNPSSWIRDDDQLVQIVIITFYSLLSLYAYVTAFAILFSCPLFRTKKHPPVFNREVHDKRGHSNRSGFLVPGSRLMPKFHICPILVGRLYMISWQVSWLTNRRTLASFPFLSIGTVGLG